MNLVVNVHIVVRCCGIAYLPICGEHKLLLVFNPAAGVSFLIMKMLIDHTAFNSWKAGIFFLLLFLLLLDLSSGRLLFYNIINAILVFTLSLYVLSVHNKVK